jgi:hypothetical protein
MDITHLLYTAAASEHGVEINVSSSEVFKRRFYQVRAQLRKEGNNDFDGFTCRLCPTDPNHKVWLVRSNQKEAA